MILCKRRKLFRGLSAVALAVSAAGCNPPTNDTRERAGRLFGEKNDNTPTARRIAVIPKAESGTFSALVRRGVEDAAKKHDAEIIWFEPLAATETLRQKLMVEEIVKQKVNGIVLAPLDRTELVIPVNRAAKARIPIVAFGNDVGTKYKLTFVATDNYQAGQLAARRIGKISGGQGVVGLLSRPEKEQETVDRERGFTDTLQKEFPNLQIVKFNDARKMPDLKAIFATDENLAAQALGVLRKSEKQAKIIGFNSTPELLRAVQSGVVDSLVLQDPYQIGFKSIEAIADSWKFEQVAPTIKTEVTLATKENLNTPQIQRLLE